jgi:hypothetical protein
MGVDGNFADVGGVLGNRLADQSFGSAICLNVFFLLSHFVLFFLLFFLLLLLISTSHLVDMSL